MKRVILIIGIIVFVIAINITFGQDSGAITYEMKIDLRRNAPPGNEQMRELPQPPAHKDLLVFNATESLYKPIVEDETFDQDDGNVRMIIRRPLTEVYYNHDQSYQIIFQELMGKKYRIEDSLKILPWKLGTETKTVLDYSCHQASYYDEERKQNIVAWYTDKLRPFLGPDIFNSLPGAVMAVDINDGERIITAVGIEFRSLKKNELKISTGGTKVTQEEFNKMRQEQTQRMRSNGGAWIIRE